MDFLIHKKIRKTHYKQLIKSTIHNIPYLFTNEIKFFALSAGNSGSAYLVELLKANGLERSYHEFQPDLDEYGVKYYLGEIDSNYLKWVLRLTRKKVKFESSNRLFSLGRLILEVYPNSKFIILVRDPKEVVRSSINKSIWPEIWNSNRLRYSSRLGGDPQLSAFERTCHYWNNYYVRILDDLKEQDFFVLKFEDLVKGKTAALADFFGITFEIKKIPPVNTKENLKPKKQKLGHYHTWTDEQKSIFNAICLETGSILGY